MNELPTIQGHTHTTSSYNGVGMINQLTSGNTFMYEQKDMKTLKNLINTPVELKKEKIMPSKRLVQVFIADPDPKMPLDDSLIYEGETLLTDSDDEELFFDLPIKELLIKHNEKREKVVDKKATDRSLVQYLEPIRIRELKMTVVTLAEF